jgi:hypothetical protein
MVHVADVTALDDGSGVTDLLADARSEDGGGAVEVSGGSVRLQASKAPRGRARSYVLSAQAADAAGNTATGSAACVVPHSRGG